ncbi:hypothetical protein V6N11_042048 [Hibiscus sabdariffa]|uniref:Gnk2-homologous domain-containing protein n=1 Tax=Hibiscus sabdariffa TaxID=183260 RepID=A0ABR2QVN1_9ROSI
MQFSLRFLLYFSLLSSIYANLDDEEMYSFCNNTGNYTSGSTYSQNVNATLFSLTANASLTGFFTTAVGASDMVYGLVQCRPDVPLNSCRACVNTAAEDITRLCPNQKEAMIGYNNCLCALNASKFAVGTIGYSQFSDIYGMVQCTRDLSENDCSSCLQAIVGFIPQCCDQKQGARIYAMSCGLRFELYAFFSTSTPPISGIWPPPSVSPVDPSLSPGRTANTNTSDGKRSTSKTMVIVVVSTAAVSLLAIVVVGCCYFWRKAKKNATETQDDYERTMESLLIGLDTLKSATENFSDENKLGQGGFGPVYKAWLHWTSGTAEELIDPVLADPWPRSEAFKCIHIGLLCVQETAADRPSMSDIISMLGSHSVTAPVPSQPAFFVTSRNFTAGAANDSGFGLDLSQSADSIQRSVNEVTISELYPR